MAQIAIRSVMENVVVHAMENCFIASTSDPTLAFIRHADGSKMCP